MNLLNDNTPSLNRSIFQLIDMSIYDRIAVRDFLLHESSLLTTEAIEILRSLHMDSSLNVPRQIRTRSGVFVGLLEHLWQIYGIAPLITRSNEDTGVELLAHYQKYDIRSVENLREILTQKPKLYQELLSTSLAELSELEWMIVVLLTCVESEDLNEYFLIEFYHELIEYDCLLRIETYLDMGKGTFSDRTYEALQSAKNFLTEYREEELTPGNGQVYLLVEQYFHTKSWIDARGILEANKDLLLTETGISEMERILNSVFATTIIDNTSIWSVGAAMMSLYVLKQCHTYDTNIVFDGNHIPTISIIMWTIGGLLYLGDPSIRTWEGYQHYLSDEKEPLEYSSRFLNAVLSSPDDEIDVHSIISTDAEPQLEQFTPYALLYFTFTSPPKTLLDLLGSESILLGQSTVSSIETLIAANNTRNQEEEFTANHGLLALIRYPHRTEIVTALDRIKQDELEAIAPTGAAIATIVGYLVTLLDIQIEEEREKILDRLDETLPADMLLVLELLGDNLDEETQLKDQLASVKVRLEKSTKFGRTSSWIGQIFEKPELKDAKRLGKALMMWFMADTFDGAYNVVVEYPELIEDEAIKIIEDFLSEIDTRIPPELDELRPNLKYAIARKYSDLLGIRRTNMESAADFERSHLEHPDVMHAHNLILSLEIALPAKIWVPVSRVDLTSAFFELLSLWQAEVEANMGTDYAWFINGVATRAHIWKEKFEDANEDHTLTSSGLLQSFLHIFDPATPNTTYEFMGSHPELLCKASLDIIGDWIISATGCYDVFLEKHLKTVHEWLRTAVTFDDLEFAWHFHFDPERRELFLTVASDMFGLKDFANPEDALKQIMEIPQEELSKRMLNFSDKLGANPLSAEIKKGLRKSATEIELRFGMFDAHSATLINDLLDSPELREVFRGADDPKLQEFLTIAELCSKDPLMRKYILQEELTQDEDQLIVELLAVIITPMLISEWALRLLLMSKKDDLYSARAWILIVVERETILSALTEKIDTELALNNYTDVRNFVEKVRETSFTDAQAEVLAVEFGDHIYLENNYIFLPSVIELMRDLSFSTLQTLFADNTVSPLQQATLLEEYEKGHELAQPLRATLFDWVGIQYKTHHETTGQVQSLNDAIMAYTQAVTLTANSESLRKVFRLSKLADALRIRFEEYGNDFADIENAIAYLRQATRFGITDAILLGKSFGFLGTALSVKYEAIKDIESVNEAIEALNKAIEITPEAHPDWIGWHINLAGIYDHLGDELNNTEYQKRSYFLLDKCIGFVPEGNPIWWTIKLNMLSTLTSIGNPNAAIAEYLRITDIDGADQRLAQIRLNLGNALRTRFRQTFDPRDLLAAIEIHKQAIDTVTEHTKLWIILTSNLVGSMRRFVYFFGALDIGLLVDLVVRQESLLKSPAITVWPSLFYEQAQSVGDFYVERTMYREAIETYDIGIRALNIMWERSENIEDKKHFVQNYFSIYNRLIGLCLHIEYVGLAYEYLLNIKGRLELHLLTSTAKQEILDTLAHQDAELKALIHESLLLEQRKRGIRAKLTGEAKLEYQIDGHFVFDFPEALKELNRLEEKHLAIWKRLRKKQLRFSSPIVELGMPQFPLRRAIALSRLFNTVILDYVELDSSWGVFVVSRQEVSFIHLVDNDEELPWHMWHNTIVEMVQSGNPDKDVYRAVVHEIYEIFIAPIEQYLPHNATDLIISPSGKLASLPLNSVRLSSGRYLCEAYVTKFIHSIPALATLTARSSRTFEKLLLIAYAGNKESGHFLKHVDSEVTNINNIASTGSSKILGSADATLGNVLEKAPSYDVLHFACHGIFRPNTPETSGLVLVNGEWLTVPTIINRLRINRTSLVVLAACDVGQNREDISEYSSMVRAFLFAGAGSVISSLWAIDDVSTVFLMNRMYQHILDKDNPLEPSRALHEAQIWLRNATTRQIADSNPTYLVQLYRRYKLDAKPYAHPYYWGAFTYYGV